MSAQDMNNGKDWGEDARLTAFAFGELGGSDLSEVQALLAKEPGAQAYVDELRALGSELETEFASEGELALSSEQRAMIEARVTEGEEPEVPIHWLNRYSVGAAGLAMATAAGVLLPMLLGPPEGASPSSGSFVYDLGDGPSSQLAQRESVDELAALQGLGYHGGDDSDELQNIGYAEDRPYDALAALGYAGPSFGAGSKGKSSLSSKQLEKLRDLGYVGGEAEVDPGLVDSAQGETYKHNQENPFQLVSAAPLSTFSVDVDTASYANVRGMLNAGSLPPADSVRPEEFINYFRYDYGAPQGKDPFNVNVEVGSAPWAPTHRLMRVGLQAQDSLPSERKSSNLVFLLDVSGSMSNDDKLPLLKSALHLLVEELDERDRVAIVVYAGASGLLLPSTTCNTSSAIHAAIDSLESGGSTNGGAGIELAYKVAAENYIDGGINRVILGTDGDFNVGVSDEGGLEQLITAKAKTGVFLSVLGFGRGNLQDVTMETLADKGNGNYSYIDSVLEARKVLVHELGSTLEVVAKDVKIQVEFNPARVQAYRLIGYENRMLAAQDFNDDQKDAGEIGAGHRVTALYEVIPVGVAMNLPDVDGLRYQTPPAPSAASGSEELCLVKVRYKQPEGSVSSLITQPVLDSRADFQELSPDTRWATAVASFAMLLKDSAFRGDTTSADIIRWANESMGDDSDGYRSQFVYLVGRYQELSR